MTGREQGERVARWIGLGAVAGLLLLSVRSGRGTGQDTARPAGWQTLAADSSDAWRVLRSAAMREVVEDTLRLRMETLPVPSVREGLGVLARGRGPIVWEDRSDARGLAASLHPAPGAAAAWRLQLAAPPGLPVVPRDAGSVLDSVTVPATGVAGWRMAALHGAVTIRLPNSQLALAPPTAPVAPVPRVVRIVSTPGWEAKFVAAALEEAGWRVEGSLAIAPTASVRLGTPGALTPRTAAAVIVLDSAPVDLPALTRFVRAGGGLVVAGEAAVTPRWRSQVPAQVGTLEGGLAGALTGDRPRLGLAAYGMGPAPDALVLVADTLTSRVTRPLVVARRSGNGRVALSALHETWRWRMQGRDDGAAAHRRWWVELVEAVAGTGASDGPLPDAAAMRWPGDQAPYADLVARLGAPVTSTAPDGAPDRVAAPRRPTAPPIEWRVPLFLLAIAALLVEWTSRRLRGAR